MPAPEVIVTTGSMSAISTATLNGELAVLRIALNLAEEWGLSPRIRVRLLPGAKGRDFVVSPQLEAEYLEAASYPLRQVAILMLDAGLRPEECVSLRKSDIYENAILVRAGKTANAQRTLPMTERTTKELEVLCALFDSEWLFKGYKGHMTAQYISELHAELREAKGWPEEFKLYSFRHSAITRLAESGAGVYEVMKFAGHADIRMSMKYVHISNDHLALAVKRMEQMGKIMRGEVHEETPVKESS